MSEIFERQKFRGQTKKKTKKNKQNTQKKKKKKKNKKRENKKKNQKITIKFVWRQELVATKKKGVETETWKSQAYEKSVRNQPIDLRTKSVLTKRKKGTRMRWSKKRKKKATISYKVLK